MAGFNSATALRPWKAILKGDIGRRYDESFNSATALRPWKAMVEKNRNQKGTRLQFGHGVEAVEGLQAAREKVRAAKALQFGHGVEAVEGQVELRRALHR